MNSISINKRIIGAYAPVYFIADIAANHDGDLNRALKLIDLAKQSGADAVKFQHFQASKIVSESGFRGLGGQKSHQANWKKSVFEVYADASLNRSWTPVLAEHSRKNSIDFFSSPYDLDSVDHLDPYVPAFKIGSGDIDWLEIVEYIAQKGKPVLLATGASTIQDVIRAYDSIRAVNPSLCLMQCNTNYTASRENLAHCELNVIKAYAQMFPDCVLGLSDHTFGDTTVLGAVALGARVIEKHFTDDNDRNGPDHLFSMNPSTWRNMVDRTRDLESALGSSIKRVEANEKDTAIVQRRVIRTSRPLVEGKILSRNDLSVLRPAVAGGIAPWKIDRVVGRKICRAMEKDELIRREDLI